MRPLPIFALLLCALLLQGCARTHVFSPDRYGLIVGELMPNDRFVVVDGQAQSVTGWEGFFVTPVEPGVHKISAVRNEHERQRFTVDRTVRVEAGEVVNVGMYTRANAFWDEGKYYFQWSENSDRVKRYFAHIDHAAARWITSHEIRMAKGHYASEEDMYRLRLLQARARQGRATRLRSSDTRVRGGAHGLLARFDPNSGTLLEVIRTDSYDSIGSCKDHLEITYCDVMKLRDRTDDAAGAGSPWRRQVLVVNADNSLERYDLPDWILDRVTFSQVVFRNKIHFKPLSREMVVFTTDRSTRVGYSLDRGRTWNTIDEYEDADPFDGPGVKLVSGKGGMYILGEQDGGFTSHFLSKETGEMQYAMNLPEDLDTLRGAAIATDETFVIANYHSFSDTVVFAKPSGSDQWIRSEVADTHCLDAYPARGGRSIDLRCSNRVFRSDDGGRSWKLSPEL